MNLKIYLAGSCSSEKRTMMQKIAELLRSEGYTVYCPFELKVPNAWDMSQEDWANKVFNADLDAIDSCNLFLMITPGRHGTAGTNWEQGYAFAKGIPIAVFQYTDDNTSLMTYCAADDFINCTNEQDLLEKILFWIHEGLPQRNVCLTTLT